MTLPAQACSNFKSRGAAATLLLLVILLAIMSSCSNTVDPPAQTPIGGETLMGTVVAYSAASSSVVSPAGITVALQGTSFRIVADSLGHFTISNIPAGVYNIIFSKPGFDSMIYPAHHLIGVGTDIINDAYLIEESSDSIAIAGASYVFTVSVSKKIHVIDTIITDHGGGKIDTVVLGHDSTFISYDTVQNANALIVHGTLSGNHAPYDVFVYSSLDSNLYPTSPCPQSPGKTEDAWLSTHMQDPAYRQVFQSPNIASGNFIDTLGRDAATLQPYSLPAGQAVYVYVVAHSNTNGLPDMGGEYPHFRTTPFGPAAVRFKLIVP
jgi:hypothetical protein